jgi:dynamin 1-like protein
MIYLKEPPAVLRPTETHSEQEAVEIQITKLLLRSYYDIVRKNIEDSVPKAIMHFLVNHTKRELHNVFIKKLYRENLFEEMLQEPDEIAVKRKRTQETLHVLQQAYRTLDELPLEADSVSAGMSKHQELLTSSKYSTSSSYSASPSTTRRSRRAGDQHQNGYGF